MSVECKPVFLLAGGRSSVARRGPDPLLQEALQLSSIDRPSVAYVGAASGDNPIFRAMISKILQKAGSGQVKAALLCSSRSDPEKAMRVIEDCPIVFMSGGDVEEGMRVLAEKRMLEFFRGQYHKGKLFIGASAGSIILARSWVRWTDPEDDSSAELFPCIGIAPVYCDTHDEDDWEELQALAQLTPEKSVCYGIPSGAALKVYSNGSVKALGAEVHCFVRKSGKPARITNLTP
jgi:peptidase E